MGLCCETRQYATEARTTEAEKRYCSIGPKDIGCSKALNRLTAVGTDLRFTSYMSQLLAAIRPNICFANEVLIAYFPFRNYILISLNGKYDAMAVSSDR